MACLNCCIKTCIPEFDPLDNFQEEPLVDLEKIIRKCALEQLKLVPPVQLTWRERFCPLEKVVKLDVDQSFLGIRPSREMTMHPRKPQDGGDLDVPAAMDSGSTILFQSRFRNDTDATQVYSFKTERQTKSSVEMSLQRGFTFGQSLEMDVKLPTGVPQCEVSGKLGSQLQWSFQRGQVTRKEDQVTWSVDSQISVAGNNTGEARLEVRECRWTSDFVMPCKICPRTENKKIPVFVRRQKTNDLLQVIGVTCSEVVEEADDFFRLAEGDAGQILCELRGTCHVVCAVEQEIWLKQAKLITSQSQPELPAP